MNDEELREALRPRDGIEPLDPAKVIAGAQRRRRRTVAAGGASAVAVLAVVAGGFAVTNGTDGSLPVQPVGTPSSAPATPRTPSPSGTPATVGAADLAACRAAAEGEGSRPGAGASVPAVISAARGIAFIVADSKYWLACDTGYRSGSAKEVSARRPGSNAKPDVRDPRAFAVAENQVEVAGKPTGYYWAAGVVPDGVQTIRYTFPDGSTEDAVVSGKYWLMHHWSPGGGVTPAPPGELKVRVIGVSGGVLADLRLEPGVHTCAQISHGC